MIFYYFLIAIGVIITLFAIYNFINIKKIEKNFDNYLFLITSSKAYFFGATLFSLAILLIISYQVVDYIFDIKIFSIVFFFSSLFLLSLSHLIYYVTLKKKLKDYKDFFKNFEVDLDNRCEKLMLKHIYEKEKNIEKVKEVFKKNKHLCKKS